MVKLPIQLSEHITGTLQVKLSVGREMRQQALIAGYGAEEIENLLGTKQQEIAQAIADALGLDYDSEPE